MTGPTVRARQLGQALAQLRTDAKVTQKQAGGIIECSQPRIAQIEAGKTTIRRAELIVLLQHYGADSAMIEQLDQLRLDAAQPGWWSTYGLPDWLAGYVGLEQDATQIRTLALELIPGLLQAESYARELLGLHGTLSADEITARITTRLRRQERLTTATNPLEFAAVISQSALQRCVARPSEVTAAQLQHLYLQAQRSNVQIRVLPFDCGRHAGMAGGFTLLNFPSGMLPDVAWQEHVEAGHIIDEKSTVISLSRLYDKVCEQALDHEKSLMLLADVTNERIT